MNGGDKERQAAIQSTNGAPRQVEIAEITRLRLKVFSLAAENERLKNTVSYQLGSALLGAKRLRGLLALPGELVHILRVSRERRGRASRGGAIALDVLLRRLLVDGSAASAQEIIDSVASENITPRYRAIALTELSNILRPTDWAKSLTLLRHAVTLDSSAARTNLLAGALFEAGAIEEPRALYTQLQGRALSSSSAQRLTLLNGMARTQDTLRLPDVPKEPLTPQGARSVLYVAASSSPYHTTGYTSRTQALLKAIGAEGWRVHAVTRPGYPHDRNDLHRMMSGATHEWEGITYTSLAGPRSNTTPFDRYCADAARILYKHIETVRPAIVHAASNYLNALPALMAARRAGLPFVYEVRGLWELTHAAKDPRFEGSERFAWQRHQEIQVATNADLVVTLSEGLKSELIDRGVDRRRIVIAPNCVDAELFVPRERDEALARDLRLSGVVLGFIGSMTTYEGLLDLVSVLARLRQRGHDVNALLVGDGPALSEVREAAKSLGVQRHLVMPGRVPHDEVGKWYSLMDIAVYPRLPSKVTELVPPLKPLEAMAMTLPVVASDVAAIRESIVHRRNGYLFKRGDQDDLLQTLEQVIQDPDGARAVALRGREDVKELFTWSRVAKRLTEAYRGQTAG
ncbi:glycosyltransferase [Brevundimonas sp.]|uniref:glycosyltransferase n=1 Tax=Brevundimonas sp. TaxID=1871086 RepID=UPI0028A8E505|nr:glycosyltransferase [Brevundimonas sp.]